MPTGSCEQVAVRTIATCFAGIVNAVDAPLKKAFEQASMSRSLISSPVGKRSKRNTGMPHSIGS